MNVFEKLKNGDPVDMMSEEYRPAIAELHRADRALFHLNHAEPQSEEWTQALSELFNGDVPEGLGVFTPTQIDFPRPQSPRSARMDPGNELLSRTGGRTGHQRNRVGITQ